MLFDYFLLALNSLTKKKTRTYLTMIGIFIGIAAVVSLMGLGQGLRTAITSQFGFLGTDVLSIQAQGVNFAGPPGFAVPNPLSDKLVDKIEKVNGVEAAFNRYLESVQIEFNDVSDISMMSSTPGGENRKTFEKMLNLEAEFGRMLKDIDSRRVVLGSNYKKDDNAFQREILVGDKILLADKEYEVNW